MIDLYNHMHGASWMGDGRQIHSEQLLACRALSIESMFGALAL